MSQFSFDATAGASQSTSKPRLAGNEVYAVKFDECEVQDIQGVKDPSMVYKVLKLKFSNDDGSFEHTIFEPKENDFVDGETEFTNKNGNVEKIKQPSNVKSMMLLFKHAIDAINPKVAKEIDGNTKNLVAKDWASLRKLVADILNEQKGVSTNIKLVKNNKGEATFPGFFTAYNRDGKAYIRNNFIGAKLAFTPYEETRIKNGATAKPTNTDNLAIKDDFAPPTGEVVESNLDLNFKI